MTILCQANMKLASTAGMIWASIRHGENSVIQRVSRNPILYTPPSDFVSSSAQLHPTVFKEWSEAVIERESGRSSLSRAPVAASNANRLQLGEWGDWHGTGIGAFLDQRTPLFHLALAWEWRELKLELVRCGLLALAWEEDVGMKLLKHCLGKQKVGNRLISTNRGCLIKSLYFIQWDTVQPWEAKNEEAIYVLGQKAFDLFLPREESKIWNTVHGVEENRRLCIVLTGGAWSEAKGDWVMLSWSSACLKPWAQWVYKW